MPQRLGIIGHPIGHSISPVFQQAALDAIGFDGTYQPWDVAPDGLGEFVAGLREPGRSRHQRHGASQGGGNSVPRPGR